jgi:hypothetical protein
MGAVSIAVRFVLRPGKFVVSAAPCPEIRHWIVRPVCPFIDQMLLAEI